MYSNQIYYDYAVNFPIFTFTEACGSVVLTQLTRLMRQSGSGAPVYARMLKRNVQSLTVVITNLDYIVSVSWKVITLCAR